MFGTEYKKPTRFRVWGNDDFSGLGIRCFTKNGVHSCGQEVHTHLEYGGLSTADAAVYPEPLCEAYAATIKKIVEIEEYM